MKENQPQFELVTICPPMVYGQVAQYVASADQLNTSSAALYAVFSGQQKEVASQRVMLFCNVADVGIAHVLAIVRVSPHYQWFLSVFHRMHQKPETIASSYVATARMPTRKCQMHSLSTIQRLPQRRLPSFQVALTATDCLLVDATLATIH